MRKSGDGLTSTESTEVAKAKSGEQGLLAETQAAKATGPVECLGLTFETEDARRKHFRERLRERLKDPQFRKTRGFPIADDDDILRLSDPPYYTACPNPFLEAFVQCHARPYDPATPYRREPMAVDVSEGKTDPIYTAHAYHTKVPHQAIMRAILHYTEPGDLVLDGFAGSGMTGVAVQMCAAPESAFKQVMEVEWKAEAGRALPRWGRRSVILNDLSPAATFIAANYNLPFYVDDLRREAQRILDSLATELGWMYETLHQGGKAKGRINYTVWSEVFGCPECGSEVVFYNEALDPVTKRVRENFPCPNCSADLTKDNLQRLMESGPDPATGQPWKRIRLVPVLINYSVGKGKYEKRPDEADLGVLDRIIALPIPPSVPTVSFPIETMYHGSRLAPKGFTRVHHLYLPRAAQSLGALWERALALEDPRTRNMVLFMVEQAVRGMSLLNRYKPIQYGKIGGTQVGLDLNGVYYVPSIATEVSPWYQFEGKLKRLIRAFASYRINPAVISTGSAEALAAPSDSVDYIFTDPPFGENIFYADLNFMVEAWHHTWTASTNEAIVDGAKGKGLPEYQHLMQRCFEEYRRVLKPGRWMTVVFHNSRNSVWNAIQEAMQAAGFVVADVRTMDKQQGSYRQVTSSAMKQDLVISAYKPNDGLEERFKLKGGSEEGAWDFVRTHLRQLPVFVSKEGEVEPVAERQANLLYDRMVAFHVLRGVMVPLSATEFFGGLASRFPAREGMYFLTEQVAEYDKKRLGARGVRQLDLFVHDEASAIEWLRQQLLDKPHTLQELTPRFLKEIAGWEKYEKPLELLEIVRQNFLRYDGTGDVPNQIHSYLSTNFKELRKLPKDHAELRGKAKERWYVPDPGKAGDLEKLREKTLLQEFWEYLPAGHVLTKPEDAEGYLPGFEPKRPAVAAGRKMKIVRLEAVRAGFKYCWQNRDYKTIIAVAQRIPEDVLLEDPKLLMWYDQALTRSGPV